MALERFNNSDVVGNYNSNPGQGDNQIARYKNLNVLVDAFNAMVMTNPSFSSVYRIGVEGSPLQLPLTRMVGVGVSPGDCPHCRQMAFQKCGVSEGWECTDGIAILEKTASPGVYDLTVSIVEVIPATHDIVVRFGNSAQLGVIINVERLSNTQYKVTAFNTQTGTTVAGALENVPLEIIHW